MLGKLYKGSSIETFFKYIYFKKKYGANIHTPYISYSSVLGKNTVIKNNSVVFNCSIGDHCYVNYSTFLFNTEIRNYSSVGLNSVVGANEHVIYGATTCVNLYDDKLFKQMHEENLNNTIIEEDAWVSANSFVKKGVRVGIGAVVAAGAVVTKDVPPYAIVGGVPAKILKYRFDEETIKRLLDSKWWEKPFEEIKSMIARGDLI